MARSSAPEGAKTHAGFNTDAADQKSRGTT